MAGALRTFVWTLMTVVLISGTCAADEGQRFALLVGNSRYISAVPLRNPENDIAAVGKSLEAVGFRTTLVANADAPALQDAVARFIEQVKAVESSVVVLYFAGHGIQTGGKNYLLPVDAKLDTRDDLKASAIEVDHLLSQFSGLSSSLQIVVLDACRNDPFDKVDRSALPIAKGLSQVAAQSGRLIAYSTAPGRTATDGDTGTSPYAAAFAESILIPNITIRAAFDRVREKVLERTKGAQEPWEAAATYGDFYFVPPTQNASISEVEALAWDNASLLDSAESYQKYIDRFPQGRFAPLARQKIDNINTDFRYRRKSETFPIITAGPEFNFCRLDRRDAPISVSDGFDLLNGLFAYRDELIYVDLVLPLRSMLCGQRTIENVDVTAVAPNGACHGIVSDFGAPHPSTTLDCNKRVNDAPEASWATALGRDGGLTLRQNSEALYLSAFRGDSYSYDFNEIEGDINQANISIRGLVRVRIVTQEDYSLYFLEPVDAAEMGLTWKYQNTVEAHRQGRDVSGAEIFTLRTLIEKNIASVEAHELETLKSYWDWNGTVLSLSSDDTSRWVTVVKPAAALATTGIEVETVIFEGNAEGGSDTAPIRGTAFVYAPGCDFQTIDADAVFDATHEALSITGAMPRFDDTCIQIGSEPLTIALKYLGSPATGYVP